MKKRFLALLLAAVLLLAAGSAAADGPMSWDYSMQAYTYAESHYGIVLCTKMTVWQQAAAKGKSYGSLKNGQPVKILGVTQNGDFYVVDLESCGVNGAAPGEWGYVKASLIKLDPEFVATTKRPTILYATPWGHGTRNGEQNGRFLLIIEQYGNWNAVQTCEGSPGTSFVKAQDLGQYTQYGQNLRVITWDKTPCLDQNTWTQISTLKRFTVGNCIGYSGDYYLMTFNEGAADEFTGLVPCLYTAPIVN